MFFQVMIMVKCDYDNKYVLSCFRTIRLLIEYNEEIWKHVLAAVREEFIIFQLSQIIYESIDVVI